MIPRGLYDELIQRCDEVGIKYHMEGFMEHMILRQESLLVSIRVITFLSIS